MQITVIIPVYNTARHLPACIAALSHQTLPRQTYELIFVDNNSTDRSLEILKATPNIRLLTEPMQSSYAARNLALRHAQADLIAFTDSDCFPDPNWLATIQAAFENPQTQLLLGCRRPAIESGGMRLLADYENQKDATALTSPNPATYYGFTNNMAVRKTTLDQYGPFLIRTRGSDTIFVRRVVDGESTSAVTYSPAMIVRHAEWTSPLVYFKKTWLYGRSWRCYSRLIHAQPLQYKARWQILLQTIRANNYNWFRAIYLLSMLIIGMAAWKLGTLSRSHAQ